jgi:enoyl-CoA hydratase/carnithine racemase
VIRQLVQLVGPANARMLLYTGTSVTGADAARIGLINGRFRAECLL